MARSRGKIKGRTSKQPTPPHVRLYWYELECPAYRVLSPAARALLVELRSLYDVKRGDNRVFCGIRRMRARCNLTQLAAERARNELIKMGWVTQVSEGSFKQKVRHATVFALENEAPITGNGSEAPKSYMRWQSSLTTPTKKDGTGIRYRSVPESGTDKSGEVVNLGLTVPESGTDKVISRPLSVPESGTQIWLPSVGGFPSNAVDAPKAAFDCKRRENIVHLFRQKRAPLVARGLLPNEPVKLSHSELLARLKEFAPAASNARRAARRAA